MRDVAQAYLNAILIPEAANKRFILVSKSLWLKEISETLNEVYGKEYPIPTHVYPYFYLKLVSFFKNDAANFINTWKRVETFDTEATKTILKI